MARRVGGLGVGFFGFGFGGGVGGGFVVAEGEGLCVLGSGESV